MKTAVMYGAGNIGRGFVGAVMSRAGYAVRFVDVDRALVDSLNTAGQYTLRVIEGEGHADEIIRGVSAIDGTRGEEVSAAVAGCDLMATAVGARILPRIAPLIAKGLKQRFAKGGKPLNIIICENLMDAHLVLEGLIKQELSGEERAAFDRNVGLVEASIGRMVPIQTPEMRAGDPLRVCVEPYSFLPVDKAAFKGEIPAIPELVPYAPFEFYIRRKLFLHNMGHACCAYLGMVRGHELIAQAIREPAIALLTRAAMLESVAALSGAYSVSAKELMAHMDDLLNRFTNIALGDSCERVGADVPRKLAHEDRLVGAMLLAQDQGIKPVYIALAAAAALKRYLAEQQLAQEEQTAREQLLRLSGLQEDSALVPLIMKFYGLLNRNLPLMDLFNIAQQEKHRLTGPVV